MLHVVQFSTQNKISMSIYAIGDLSSADNLGKQLEMNQIRTIRNKPFDTLTVFLKQFFEKVDFEQTREKAQGSYRLEKYLNIEGFFCFVFKVLENTICLEKYWKIIQMP